MDGQAKYTFGATLTERGELKPDRPNEIRGRLSKWRGKHVSVTVHRYVKSKTKPQLACFHGPVLDGWQDWMQDDRDEVKKELKRSFLVPQLCVSKLTGEETMEFPSLADLNVEQMSTFLERCIREGHQRGIEFALDNPASGG